MSLQSGFGLVKPPSSIFCSFSLLLIVSIDTYSVVYAPASVGLVIEFYSQ